MLFREEFLTKVVRPKLLAQKGKHGSLAELAMAIGIKPSGGNYVGNWIREMGEEIPDYVKYNRLPPRMKVTKPKPKRTLKKKAKGSKLRRRKK